MQLNDAGRFVLTSLRQIHSDAAGIALDAHIVMPDHIHAIIILGTNPHVETAKSIPDVIRDFKTRVNRSWPAGVRRGLWPAYEGRLWHRSYNDQLIQHEAHLETVRAYILANPDRWIERHLS
jgi:putative transposase